MPVLYSGFSILQKVFKVVSLCFKYWLFFFYFIFKGQYTVKALEMETFLISMWLFIKLVDVHKKCFEFLFAFHFKIIFCISYFLNVYIVENKLCTGNDLLKIDALPLLLVMIADVDYCGS